MNLNKKIFKLLSKYYNYLDFNIYKQSVDEFTQEYDAVYVNKLLNLITYDEIDGYLTLYKLDLLFNKYCYNDEYREYYIKLKDVSFDINYLEELNRFICLDILKEDIYREKDIKVDDIYLCNPNFIKTELVSLLKNMVKEIYFISTQKGCALGSYLCIRNLKALFDRLLKNQISSCHRFFCAAVKHPRHKRSWDMENGGLRVVRITQ